MVIKQAVDDTYLHFTSPKDYDFKNVDSSGLKQQLKEVAATASDVGKAVGRGMWNGANIVSNTIGGELKGVNNLLKYVPEKLDNWAEGTWLEPITYLNALPTRLIDKGLSKGMDKMTEWNGLVQDYYDYKYLDPNDPRLKAAYGAGTAIPIVTSIVEGARVPGIKRLFSQVQPKDVAAAAKFLPANGFGNFVRGYTGWLAKPTLAASLANIGTQVGARAFPAIDYATGMTHVNPDDSDGVKKLKEEASFIPRALAILNPSAGGNYWFNHLPGRMNALAEMAGRSAPLIASTFVDTNKGVLGETMEGTKELVKRTAPDAAAKFIKWWREPTDLKSVAGSGLQLAGDLKVKVFDPNVDPMEKWNIIRDALDAQESSAPLRYTGVQRTADPGFSFLNFSNKTDMAKAFKEGLSKTVDSAEAYKNTMIGAANRELYSAGKTVFDKVELYRAQGNYQAANKVLYDNVPELAERFLGGNAGKIRKYWDTAANTVGGIKKRIDEQPEWLKQLELWGYEGIKGSIASANSASAGTPPVVSPTPPQADIPTQSN